MHINELIPPALLQQEITNGMVRRVQGPDGDATCLYVYTQKAQYERHWNEATINARGLVTNGDGEITSRPFPKFFNYGEHPEGTFNPNAPVEVYDKLDGSLAVLGDDGRVTSKGSFTSDVAKGAQRILDRYEGKWEPVRGFTYLFEYISPRNRIVLHYGSTDDLFLLGAIANHSGKYYSPDEMAQSRNPWPGPMAKRLMRVGTLAEALEMPPRENAEGVVIRFLETDELIKVKQDDYVELHRIVTGVNAITVWEHLAVNDLVLMDALKAKNITQLLGIGPERVKAILDAGPEWEANIGERLPDELHSWFTNMSNDLALQHHYLCTIAVSAAEQADNEGFIERKDAVLWLQRHDWGVAWQTVLEVYLNDLEITPRASAAIWKQVRPNGATWGMKGEE